VKLDDPRALAQVDRYGARAVLADFPAQCRMARTLAPAPRLPARRPRVVVIAGMGGSAAGGDLLAACGSDTVDVPILVHRGYGLPAAAGPESLVVTSSYSGETAETLSAFEAALARRTPVVALTAGGTLGRRAADAGCPCVTLPAGLMPRMALGYLFLPALALLADAGVAMASSADIDDAVDAVAEMARELVPEQPTTANEAKQLALAVGDRLPVIYGGPLTGAVAYRWKTDMEENAKTLALAGALPEMNHNEIEAWQPLAAKEMHVVLLRDRSEGAEIARRFDILRDLITPSAGGISEARGRGASRIARLLTLAYLGQWTSYYLAVLRGRDPWSVPILDDIKRRLRAPAP
jgi:glucose/mannose-6-phosphate isomerase